MRSRWVCLLALPLLICGVAKASAAATDADFKAALAAAETANKQAAAVRNQWTTTAQAIAAAKKAAAAGHYDDAVREAKDAEALAKASIAQAQDESKIWQNAKVR